MYVRAMAGRPATLTAPKRSSHASLSECRNLFSIAAPLARRGVKTSPATGFAGAPARQVVGLAFLRLVGAWELYLEEVFLRYMVGVRTSAGTSVVTPTSKVARIEDAFSALAAAEGFAGTRYTSYLDWTNWKKVKQRAKAHFVAADPFRTTLHGNAKALVERAHHVRHRVAHPSKKTRATFNGIAVAYGAGNAAGKLPTGFMVGDLLVLAPNNLFPLPYRTQPSIFEAYAQLFEDLGNGIAP
jgi:hypothetical protein